jgi:hypothetical protein
VNLSFVKRSLFDRARQVRLPALLFVLAANPMFAQSAEPAQSETPEEKFQFSMHIGAARGMSAFDRQPIAGNQIRISEYRIATSAVWGAALLYVAKPSWGLRAELDAVAPIRVNEVAHNAVVQGQSVAWLGAVMFTYTPKLLCKSRCITLSAGPGAGFYELAEHKEVATRSFEVSDTQIAYATKAGIQMRAPGRLRPLALNLSDYIVKLAPAANTPSMPAMHHVVLTLGWTPP